MIDFLENIAYIVLGVFVVCIIIYILSQIQMRAWLRQFDKWLNNNKTEKDGKIEN